MADGYQPDGWWLAAEDAERARAGASARCVPNTACAFVQYFTRTARLLYD